MKDPSLFLVKNSFGLKMKKGLRNLCNGESSTSILDPQKVESGGGASACMAEQPRLSSSQGTLEEMILQLDMEEKMRRKGKVDGVEVQRHRMSCVSSCDILRSARNAALNQYPRFSLDGKDAMYRSSFTSLAPAMKLEREKEKSRRLPSVIGGESVIWCKPGVVGKLMGLDAMPIPLNTNYTRERLSAIIKPQNLRKHHTERPRRGLVGSCSRAGYCVINPVDLDIPNAQPGWPTTRFL